MQNKSCCNHILILYLFPKIDIFSFKSLILYTIPHRHLVRKHTETHSEKVRSMRKTQLYCVKHVLFVRITILHSVFHIVTNIFSRTYTLFFVLSFWFISFYLFNSFSFCWSASILATLLHSKLVCYFSANACFCPFFTELSILFFFFHCCFVFVCYHYII